jgi:2-amino-4-hydroxy-6-hydroxymethyldihydropteridine diphosphokinase
MLASSSSVAILNARLHQIFLGIGSNIEAQQNIRSALAVLNSKHTNLSISETYQSKAVGFEGPPFLNLVVGLVTDMDLAQLSRELKQLERNLGRTEGLTKFSSRTLDIDILTYDNLQGLHEGILLPRPEISYNAYVLRPFAELQPELVLPGSNTCLIDLWHAMKKDLDKNLIDSSGEETKSLVKMSICW